MLGGEALQARSGRDGFACAMLGSAVADGGVRLTLVRLRARGRGRSPSQSPGPVPPAALSNAHSDEEA